MAFFLDLIFHMEKRKAKKGRLWSAPVLYGMKDRLC